MSRWEKTAPWYMTIASTVVLMLLASYLVENIEWFKTSAEKAPDWADSEYRIYIHHLHLSMIKRSVAMFSGVAALLIGSAVALYSVQTNTNLEGSGSGWSVKLATASPGIVSMIIGAVLIGVSVTSKDHFPPFNDHVAEELVAPPNPLK